MRFNATPYVGVVVMGALVLLLFGNRSGQVKSTVALDSSPSEGTITVGEDVYVFGTISMKGGEVAHSYELKNESDAAVVLSELYTSCMCTTAQAMYSDGTTSKIAGMRGHGAPTHLERTIQPGENFRIEAVFDPAAHGPAGTGPVSRTVYLQTNSGARPVLEFKFTAEVTR